MSHRWLSLFLGASLIPVASVAQGIRGVTRRTPTAESQAAARRFFDAAGVSLQGANGSSLAPGAAPTATPPVTTAQPYLLARQPVRPGTLRPQPGVAVPLATPRLPASAPTPIPNPSLSPTLASGVATNGLSAPRRTAVPLILTRRPLPTGFSPAPTAPSGRPLSPPHSLPSSSPTPIPNRNVTR